MEFDSYATEAEEVHEGQHYLDLLDLGHVGDQQMMTSQGPTEARNFLDVCGEHSHNALRGFALMDPQDPMYAQMKEFLRGAVGKYVNIEEPSA